MHLLTLNDGVGIAESEICFPRLLVLIVITSNTSDTSVASSQTGS